MAFSAPPAGALDRALNHLLEHAPARALGELLPRIEQRKEPAALVVAGQVLAACVEEGHSVRPAAEKVLRAAAHAATRTRAFGLAVTACRSLEKLGFPAEAAYDELAQVFGQLSGAAPQAVPPSFEDAESAPAEGELLDLVDRIEAVCEQVAAKDIAVVAPGATEVLCSKLGREELTVFARALSPRVIAAGEVILREGEPGRAAYFLARGELEVIRGPSMDAREVAGPPGSGLVLARLGAGSLFGEMALLSRSPRAASVVAVRPSIVLRGSRRVLDAVAEQNPRLGKALAAFCRRRMVDNLARTAPVLMPLRPQERRALLERFRTQTFEAGQVLIREGQEGAGLHLVASGSLRVLAGEGSEETLLATLGKGEVAGEVELVLRRPARTTVAAQSPAVTLHLPQEDFLAVVREHPELLAELYQRAVQLEEETRNLLTHEAQDASDLVLV